jgi:glucose/mannose-6-phosphate isomerase
VTPGLDDPQALRVGDPSGMLDAFVGTGEQLDEAYRAARDGRVPPGGEARSLVVCAMGGSAAAGDIVAVASEDRVRVPVSVLRGYRLPAAIGPEDLVACVSYSGDTEETVAAHAEAVARGARVVAVCSGGELSRRAEEAGTPVARITGSAPVPRAGLGELVGGLTGVLVSAAVLPAADAEVDEAARILETVAREDGPDAPASDNEAKQIAEWVGDRIPVVWGSEGVSAAAAWRWKTAFNENAEVPAFASALPELDHHEVVGWTGDRGKGFRLVILRESGEHGRVQERLDATLEEVSGSGLEWREVRARGTSSLARAMSLAVIGDLTTAYHALSRGIDPAAMEALVRIKGRLGGSGR